MYQDATAAISKDIKLESDSEEEISSTDSQILNFFYNC